MALLYDCQKKKFSHWLILLKGATIKEKNMLPIGSIFFSLIVAPMGIENNFKGH